MLIYQPAGLAPKASRQLSQARARNAARDQIDLAAGAAPPGDCPLDIQIRTAMDALACALQMKDWDCAAEALALLQDAELAYRLTFAGTPHCSE